MNRILTAVAVEGIARGESPATTAARGAGFAEEEEQRQRTRRPLAKQGRLDAAADEAAGLGDAVPAEGGADAGGDDPAAEAAESDAEGGSSTSCTSSRRSVNSDPQKNGTFARSNELF